MMKPWEETWEAERLYDEDGPDVWYVLGEYQKYLCARSTKAGPFTEERARFISAAPDMARALLKLEWAGSSDECDGYCLSCLHCQRADCLCSGPRVRGTHAEDCDWVRVMRKAGVVE